MSTWISAHIEFGFKLISNGKNITLSTFQVSIHNNFQKCSRIVRKSRHFQYYKLNQKYVNGIIVSILY